MAAFANAFKSERLVYHNMEDVEAHWDWVWRNLWSDPVNAGLASSALLTPPSQGKFKQEYNGILKTSLISVFICLPPGLPPAPGGGGGYNIYLSSLGGDSSNSSNNDRQGAGEPAPIGILTLSRNAEDCFRRRTTLSITLATPYQNKGYGREAINWALDWAFTFADMHRVDICTLSFNERAAALYERIGFKREGVTREVVFRNRQYWDMINFGILESEWKQLRGLV